MKFGIVALFCLRAAAAASCGRGLECSFKGDLIFQHSSDLVGDVTLTLNISHNQDRADGSLVIYPIGVAGVHVPVAASVTFSRGGREALVRWPGPAGTANASVASANYTALIIGLTPESVWLHGSGGLLLELTRTGDDEAPSTAPAANANASTALAPVGRGPVNPRALSMTIGSLHRFRSLDEPMQCLVASASDPVPRFGACTSELALWEVQKGRNDNTRALRHDASGLCLVRQCYKGGTHPLRLGKCSDCGAHRWMVEGSYLTSQSVTSNKLYCVGRQAASAPEPAADGTAESTAEAANETLVTTPCDGELAERIVNEAARMTLSLPSASVDTLLDDWLAEVAHTTYAEVSGLRTALDESLESDRAARLAMSLEGERFTAEVSRLKAEGEGLRTDLAAEATARQKAADALTATEKQLKAAQVARKEAHESEKKWRLELVDHQSRGAGLEEAAAAAAAAADGKAKEAGALNATVLSLNASLVLAERRAEEAHQQYAEAEARARAAEAEKGGLAGRAAAREAALEEATGAAAKCEARIQEEWKDQQACAAAAKEAKEWAAKYDTQKRKADEAAAEAEASRAAAIGKEEADGAARACAEGRQDVSDRVARLEAAQERAQAQLKQLAASEQAALRKEGATAEAARLSEEKLKACGAERKALSSRIAQLEAEAAALSEAKQSCTEELGLYVAHVGRRDGDAGGAAHWARMGRSLRALARSDYETLRAHASRVAHGVSAAAKEGKDYYNAFARHYAKAKEPPSLVDIPISARVPSYLCVLLVLLLLRAQWQMRQMGLKAKRDEQAALELKASLRALQQLLESTPQGQGVPGAKRDGGRVQDDQGKAPPVAARRE